MNKSTIITGGDEYSRCREIYNITNRLKMNEVTYLYYDKNLEARILHCKFSDKTKLIVIFNVPDLKEMLLYKRLITEPIIIKGKNLISSGRMPKLILDMEDSSDVGGASFRRFDIINLNRKNLPL